MPTNWLSFIFVIGFLVPGFISYGTFSLFIAHTPRPEKASYLRFIAFSCWNFALCSPLIYLLFTLNYFLNSPKRSAIAFLVIFLISPVLIGGFFGFFSQKGFIRELLKKVRIHILHPAPTAWDYKFGITGEPKWILVTLKDGSKIFGLFGSRSFASSERDERDLFLQRMFKLKEDGSIEEDKKNDGVLIKGDGIKVIEFWTD